MARRLKKGRKTGTLPFFIPSCMISLNSKWRHEGYWLVIKAKNVLETKPSTIFEKASANTDIQWSVRLEK
jgi:hypothetical protein